LFPFLSIASLNLDDDYEDDDDDIGRWKWWWRSRIFPFISEHVCFEYVCVCGSTQATAVVVVVQHKMVIARVI